MHKRVAPCKAWRLARELCHGVGVLQCLVLEQHLTSRSAGPIDVRGRWGQVLGGPEGAAGSWNPLLQPAPSPACLQLPVVLPHAHVGTHCH